MARKHELALGGAILLLGIVLAAQKLAQLHLWRYVWPGLLVLLGIWVLWRAAHTTTSAVTTFRLVGDIVRQGPWQGRDEAFYLLAGAVELDLTAARLPESGITLSCSGLAGDVRLRVPDTVPVRLTATALVGEAHLDDQQRTVLARSVTLMTPGLEQAQGSVTLHTTFIVSDIHITRVQ